MLEADELFLRCFLFVGALGFDFGFETLLANFSRLSVVSSLSALDIKVLLIPVSDTHKVEPEVD
jgi:hypothetical protein